MSKQEKRVPQILICIFSTYERTGWYHPELGVFLESLRENNSYATLYSKSHNFIPIEGGRNTAANAYKDFPADWIVFVDNDMSPPMNILDCVKDAPADAGVVVPKFFLWDETNLQANLCWGSNQGAERVYNLEAQKWHELDKCGTGLIFIRPEVFRKIPAPWFWRTYDDLCNMTSTEDINFALKVREHGFKIYGNSKFEVGHHHSCNLSAVARAINNARIEGYKMAVEHAITHLGTEGMTIPEAISDMKTFQKQSESPSEVSSQGNQVCPTGDRLPEPATSPVC
jgi:hypothetical protein